MVVWIFDVVGQHTRGAIQPDVADHAVNRRVGTGGQRCVTDDRLCIGVAMMRIFIDRAVFEQVAESAFSKLAGMPAKQIAPKLVHGDLQDEPWRFAATLGGRTADRGQHQQEKSGGLDCAARFHEPHHSPYSSSARSRAQLAAVGSKIRPCHGAKCEIWFQTHRDIEPMTSGAHRV
jgi:hypothetical protein